MIRSRLVAARISPILASATLAHAQCYQFNGFGATLKVNITSFNLVNPPVTIAGSRSAIGQSTQTSTSTFDGQQVTFALSNGVWTADTDRTIIWPVWRFAAIHIRGGGQR